MCNLPCLLQCSIIMSIVFMGLHHHGEAADSSARLAVRLISYENPSNLRISGASCDSMSSPCDPTFELTAVWTGPDIRATSPCLSNRDRIHFPDELESLPELAKPVISKEGPMPSWADIRISIKDCLYGKPTDLIADFELNVTATPRVQATAATAAAIDRPNGSLVGVGSAFSEGQLAVRNSGITVGEAAELAMKPVRFSPESIRMKISVWVECSPGYYGKGCDIRCEIVSSCCCDSEGKLRCDGSIDCSEQQAAKLATTTSAAGANNGGSNNSENRNKDDATSVMFIAVMSSSMTSIFILAIIALVAIKMCKASESNALIISRLVSQDASSVDTESAAPHLRRQQNYYQLQQHQNLGYFNPASYNTLNSQVTNMSTIVSMPAVTTNRTDSGVYEDPQEPTPDPDCPPPPPPPRPLQQQSITRPNDEVHRMPQSKSYSRRAATMSKE